MRKPGIERGGQPLNPEIPDTRSREELLREIALKELEISALKDQVAEIPDLKRRLVAGEALIKKLLERIKRLFQELNFADKDRIELTLVVEKLQEKAQKDPKFDVLNIQGFEETVQGVRELLNRNAENSTEKKTHGALMIIDIDFFRKINSDFGHPAADEALQALVDELRRVTRNSDIIGRWGGEEFVVFFPNSSAEEIHQKFKPGNNRHATFHVNCKPKSIIGNGESEINITVSGGIVSMNEGDDLKKAIKDADKALLSAKETGRDKILIADRS